jgi:hypothetical protein
MVRVVGKAVGRVSTRYKSSKGSYLLINLNDGSCLVTFNPARDNRRGIHENIMFNDRRGALQHIARHA